MRKSIILFVFIALAGVMKAQMPQPQALPIDPEVRFGKLENGMTYYIRHNGYPEQRADFYIAQKVGSMQEEDDQAGLAHFLEHMAFNGTKHYPGRKTMLNYLETIGAQFGSNVNAYTSFDETVYNLSNIPVIRPQIIDSCLLILHDWSSFITLEDEEIDKERAIIKEEWRTRSGAQIRIWEKQLPILFKDSKYADRLPIGKMEVVENFPYQVLKDYYHKWYRPDLQAIIVVGDIDVDAVEAKIKTMFADIPKPVNPAERVYYPVPDNDEPIIAVTTDPEATSTNIMLFMKHDVVPSEIKNSDQGLVFDIMKSLASSMLSERFNEISMKSDAPFTYAYSYDGEFFVSKTKDAWTTGAGSKENKIKETLASMVRENERVKKFGFTETEVERAKANMLKRYENSYNNRNKELNNRYVNEYVRSFSDNEPIPGIEYEYEFVQKLMPMISAQLVNMIAQQLISDKNVVISVTGPEKEGLIYPSTQELLAVFKDAATEDITAYAEEVSNEPLITQLPAPGTIVKEEKGKFDATVWTLSNGMKVVLKKTDYKDDQIIMSSYSYGGQSLIPTANIQDKNLVSSVVRIGGLGNFNAVDLRKTLSGKTVSVNPAIYQWTQSFVGNSSIKDVETMFQLLYLSFTAPHKDEESFKSTIESFRNQLKNINSNPNVIFSDSINSTMYGNNPRTKRIQLSDVDNLDYDRILNIYKQLYANPGSFVFTFVGTVDEAAMRPLVEQYLASLPSGNKDAKYDINSLVESRNGEVINTFTQEMQTPKASVYNVYKTKLARNLKTEVTLTALKQVMDIVYTDKIREQEGGTYGVGTGTRINRIPEGETSFIIMFDTDPERYRRLNDLVIKELKEVAANGPRAEDLQKVKEYMNKKYQEDIKTNNYWLNVLDNYYFFNEDKDSDYLSILNAITGDDIRKIANDIISQDNFIEVIMTPAE